MKSIIILLLTVLAMPLFSQQIDTDYSKNKKRAIKMEFFSPLTGNTTIGYESYIKDWLSWEAKIGMIGLGVNNSDNVDYRGMLIKGGPKFKLNPDFVTDDLKGSHLLGGKYIRPEVSFVHYTERHNENNPDVISTKRDFTSIAFLITYGRQYILANILTLDYHIGLGYGYDSSRDGGYHFSHANGDSSFPIAYSVGFTIGVLLN